MIILACHIVIPARHIVIPARHIVIPARHIVIPAHAGIHPSRLAFSKAYPKNDGMGVVHDMAVAAQEEG